MKQSQYFLKTSKTFSEEDKIISAKLLKQAGFIQESVAGRYYFLPAGQRVQQKIMSVIKEEMDKVGAQEMLAPILHPLELWKETNRTSTTGFELMKVKDRRESEFALGGTAEEMFVDLVRKYQLSYKDLPFQLYQFSPKFRDELRARGGLLRVREFIMKDGYSFHRDEEDFKKTYEKMKKVYTEIFSRFGLKTYIVESDNGYIGGEYCHEFIVESEIGESKFLMTPDGSYAAHEDIAKFTKLLPNSDDEIKPKEEIKGEGVIGVEELEKFLKISAEQTTKTILFETEKGEVVAATVSGIYDINEVKLKNVLRCADLKMASAETIKRVTGAEVGYAGIINLPQKVKLILDDSLKGRKNLETGANKTDYHCINVNFGRDIEEPENFYDIALAKQGYLALDGKQKLSEKKGIEVGNIFQLGYHYTNLMKGAVYRDEDGTEKPYYMGCYGIGVGRTMATLVEKFNDDRGILWPAAVAPFKVHLIGLKGAEKEAENLYKTLLKSGFEVLYDDRDQSAGAKFADSDLIGIPYRLVVSPKTVEKGSVELKVRSEAETKLVKLSEIEKHLK
ncbi:MAG TPA: proline--tRNA ligase [Candidatus Limnocylindria bacterium]|nr:proline--tRNA ligase [Candidatus Limnocylindria bacterium]